ncbi:DUF5597 domain-containing protein [Streptomyces sp. NPDC058671]|uniref:DUF5597 domain-containing protein n=1 Tax=Streptomyces sp. NPDC058671 TaxID=3346590 RepID=UPI0036651C25
MGGPRTVRALAALESETLRAQPEGRVRGFRVEPGEEQVIRLAAYEFVIRVHTERVDGEASGHGLLLQVDTHTFIAAGHNFTVDPSPRDGRPVALLRAEELVVQDGRLSPQRRLNGDETFAGTRIRIAETPAPMHGFMLTTGTQSGIVRFSVYSRETAPVAHAGDALVTAQNDR